MRGIYLAIEVGDEEFAGFSLGFGRRSVPLLLATRLAGLRHQFKLVSTHLNC